MATSQNHGIVWESGVLKFIKNKFKIEVNTATNPTAKWDIPGVESVGLLPTSVKAQGGFGMF